jgi:hypothetical protein
LCISCDTETVDYGFGEYFEEIATATSGNAFLSDQGKKILSVNEKPVFEAGERVYLNYTLLPETTPGFDYTVRINGSSKIPVGKIKRGSQADVESAVREAVHFESIWIGSHYLNMQFYINYKSEAHTIGMIVDSTRLDSDTIHMYFDHNPNHDPVGYPVHLMLSFDLKDLPGDPGNNKNLLIDINTNNYGLKTYALQYSAF